MPHFGWFIGLGTVIIFVGLWLTYIHYRYSDVKRRNEELVTRNSKILSQKKSSEVRLGKIGENMAPFFEEWPYDPNNFRFLGSPVDGVQFTDEEIIFMEVKTGKSRLTNSQKTAKRLVKEGKVKFVTFRIGEDGCTLREE